MSEKLVIANPFDDSHILLFKKYEDENNSQVSVSKDLEKIRSSMTEEEYNDMNFCQPETNTVLFTLHNGKIISYALLMGEKDRRVCRVVIEGTTLQRKEKILNSVEFYAFDVLEMEELFVLQANDSLPPSYFINNGYEDLGLEDDMRIYLKSKTNVKDTIIMGGRGC